MLARPQQCWPGENKSCVWYMCIYTVGAKRTNTNHRVIYHYAFDLIKY